MLVVPPFALPALAQAQAGAQFAGAQALEPLFVTAARDAEPIDGLVADVTVIDRDAIAAAGVDSLTALLQGEPGVEVVQNGGPGATSGVFLRGANAAQTLVLVDGMRLSSASSGATALEAIPLDQIERIEILRGPASSLYGADAIGGVIQIFTRGGGAGRHADASIGYGTYGTISAAAGASGGSALMHGSVDLSQRHSDGFNAIVNPANPFYDPDRDGYRNSSVNARGVLMPASGQSLSLQYFRSRLDNQFDGGDAYNDRTATTESLWQARWASDFASWWRSRLSAGEGGDDSVSLTGYGSFPFHTRQRQYTWQSDFTLSPDGSTDPGSGAGSGARGSLGTLTLALERREEHVDTEPAFTVDERDTDSATAIYRVVAGATAVQANLRYDHSNQFGGRTTGAFEWGYRLSPTWRVTASAGTAFRPPTFNDLYYPGFSNPSLAPESARNVEAGLRAQGRSGPVAWHAQAVAYENRVRDLIVFQCDANFNCQPNNVANATLRGVTLTGDLGWKDATLRASLDLQSPTDDASGNLLPRRARRHATVAYSQPFGALRVVAQWIGSSARFDDAANLRRMGGYGIVNLTAELPVGHGVTLFARADNLFDKNYELAADFATGGARFFAGLRWRL
ncbi:MAG: TonB-dependent receptor [Proteobacteria bacterium]|nr:TonB-dependent receptor [Pseudomonadota bacterium]